MTSIMATTATGPATSPTISGVPFTRLVKTELRKHVAGVAELGVLTASAMVTRSCRSLEEFEQDRRILIGAGISADFLPDACGLGATPLLPPHGM